MPKDEFDIEDPFEMHGVVLPAEPGITDSMTDCIIEEFLRLGFDHWSILRLFQDPNYLGPHSVWCSHGENYIRSRIEGVCMQWGLAISWEQAPPVNDASNDTKSKQPKNSILL